MLNSVDVVLRFAQMMKWKGSIPAVKLVKGVYETGKKLTKKVMPILEQRFEREPVLGK